MDGRNRSLQCVRAEATRAQGFLHQSHSLRNLFTVPERAVLMLQQNQLSGRRGPRRAPGFLQQHQGKQPIDFRLRLEPGQQPSKSDRLFAQYDKSMIVLKLAGARMSKRAQTGRYDGRNPRRALWPKLKKPEERKDVGRALTPDQERALLAAADRSDSPMLAPFIRIALLTDMRFGEIRGLKCEQIDFEKQTLRVGLAKTAAGTA